MTLALNPSFHCLQHQNVFSRTFDKFEDVKLSCTAWLVCTILFPHILSRVQQIDVGLFAIYVFVFALMMQVLERYSNSGNAKCCSCVCDWVEQEHVHRHADEWYKVIYLKHYFKWNNREMGGICLSGWMKMCVALKQQQNGNKIRVAQTENI